jgi:hypothetical protein
MTTFVSRLCGLSELSGRYLPGHLPHPKLSRRDWGLGVLAAGATVAFPESALGFGEDGAFHARILSFDKEKQLEELSAARRWAWELTRRSSAPGRLAAQLVRPDSAELLQEPFAVWVGKEDSGPLPSRAIRSLREYLRLGGMLVIDDRGKDQSYGKFSQGVKRELRKVLPEAGVIQLPPEHVLFKTYYILEEPMGRRPGPPFVEAIVRGKTAQVIFLNHDLTGALARKDENWAHPMEVGGAEAREMAVRFAVNIAMYVLCSDYKDDQVHAPFLMRRRHKKR